MVGTCLTCSVHVRVRSGGGSSEATEESADYVSFTDVVFVQHLCLTGVKRQIFDPGEAMV